MVLFYAEALRNVVYRDNNWKGAGNNLPAITSHPFWGADAGVTATTDGDIMSVSGTDATHSITSNLAYPTTNNFLVCRAKGAGSLDIQLVYAGGAGTDTFTMGLSSQFKTFSFPLTRPDGSNFINFRNQTVTGTNSLDYVAICGKPPVQLSQKDLISGVATRTALGVDQAQIRMNNWRGKFVSGPNALGFGDHLHIYLGQGANPFHIYGGYIELAEPTMPNDEIMINSRGFGVALLRAKVLQSYSNQTPRTIFNNFVDNQINALSIDKNGISIPTNYQITRSFVQDIGSAIPLYLSYMNPVYNAMRELADLNTAQSSPSLFFVDPAENLHLVPLGAQGAANWGTDPIPAIYSGSLVLGQNLIMCRLPRDTQSVVNRVHYEGISQSPGLLDAWTEFSTNTLVANNWDSERLAFQSGGPPVAVTWNSVTSPVALGTYAVNAHVVSTVNGAGGAFFYPKSKNLALDINSLGSAQSPPLFEFYFRAHNPQGINAIAAPDTIFFYWYHLLVPIGPHGGTQFSNPPLPNTIATATYTGTSGYQLPNVGTPHWTNINYIGFSYSAGVGYAETADFYLDGWRILGGRYRIAYDNRASPPRYPDMSEAFIYDPVSKDENAIKNYAKAELLRLRNPILRGPAVVPLLGDLYPEQQILCTIPSAGYTNAYLRATQVTHRFSPNGVLTEISLSDDFTNSQPLQPWRLANVLLEMGENAIFSRQLADLKSASFDPTFSPILDPYS